MNFNKMRILVTNIVVIALIISGCAKGDEGNKDIQAYFNKCVNSKYGEKKWGDRNLETELLKFIEGAEESIDMCAYEINLPEVIQALIEKASEGIKVRIIVDGKDASERYRKKRYQLMRVYLEKLARGEDFLLGTDDDVKVFADSPIFMVEDGGIRKLYGLPQKIEAQRYVSIDIGRKSRSGFLLCWGEIIREKTYASPGNQMHNKFVVVDKKAVWTGSWNYTVTGLYGTYENARKGELGGNQQHCLRLNNEEIAQIYTAEFTEMWGSTGDIPDPEKANFSSRKNNRDHYIVEERGRRIEIFFSPSEDVREKIEEIVSEEDKENMYFSLFCLSDMDIMKALIDKNGESFIRMVIDEGMWNQKWSSIRKMNLDKGSIPVFEDHTEGKLHSKTGVLDPFQKDNVVITGSMNWTKNGGEKNDENLIIIYGNGRIAEMFYGEIMSRVYESAY